MKKSAIRKISGYKLPDFETSSTSSVDTSKMIKIGEASRLRGISIDTLRRWERKGWLKTYKTPGGTRLYDRAQLQKLNPSLKKGPKEVISPLVRVQVQNQEVIEQVEAVDTFKPTTDSVQTISINLQSDQSSLTETKKILPEIVEETRYGKAETFSPSGEKIETVYIKFKRTLFSVALLFIITSAFSVPGYLLTNYIINTKTASNIGNVLSNLPFSKSADFTRRLADLFSPGVSQKLFSKYPPGSPPGLMTRKVNKELSPAQQRDLGYLNGGNFSQKNGSVLAESTPSGSYLQINLDTQINGTLSVDTASVSGKLFADTVNTGFGDNEVYPMDQALLTSSSVSFNSISGGTINLSGASNQILLANTIISTQTNGSGAYTVSIPTLSAAGNFVIDNVSQTLTNKTISGSSNTFSDIPTSALSSSAITINTAGTLTGGGSVSLGGSITITGAASGVTSIAGTSNQVIASASTGDITLSLPQDIATTSTPTFAGVLLSGSTSGTLTLNAAATTTSYTLTLPADDGTNNYVLTTDGSGSTSWQAVGGGACSNCILTDPSTSQTITPTSSTAIGLSIAQASGGSVDVFNITNNAGSTKYFQVNSSGNISIAQTLTLGTGTVGLYTGAGAPSNGLGADGDYYFRNDGTTGNSSIYYKVSSAWISAGGGSLQNAYDVGSTITTTSGNSVAITLADVATPTQFSVTQQDPAGTSAIYLNNANASGTNTNGILVEQTGGGTLTNGINITQTSGTLTNGLNLSGTFTNLINSSNFIVSNAGSVTAATSETINGIDISSGSISDVEGYTQSTGTFAFSGGGNFSIDSAGLDLTTGGAVSGVTGYSQTSGAFSATGLSSGSISVTGASLALATVTSGDITATTATGTGLFNVVTGNLKVGNGSPTITQDGEDAYVEGTFEVDGVSTFGGNVGIGTTATTKALTVNGVIRSGSSLAVDIDGNNGAGPLVRWTDTTVSDFMTMGSTGGTNNIDTLTRDFRIYSTAATSGIMFKQDSGNVGIGTTTPLALLHVGSGGTPGVASTDDVYIQNDLEVDGITNFAGAATFGSTTTLNGLTYTWPGSQSSGQVLSTNGSGTLSWTDPDSLTVRWNSINDPNGNQTLAMADYTSTWNWATGTSTNDLFNITSDASADGTGSLVNIQTGASSTLLPLRVRAGSSEALTVNAGGNVGIGTTAPAGKLNIVAGTLTSTNRALYTTATLPTSGDVQGARFEITSSGTAVAQTALQGYLTSGYTGSSITIGIEADNAAASTGNNFKFDASIANALGNAGLNAFTWGTTTGLNIGGRYEAANGGINAGVVAKANTGKDNATNIGLVATGRNTNTGGTQVGGWFFLGNSTPTWESAALVADNSDQTSPIFLGKDNGSTVFTLADGGNITWTGATLTSSSLATFTTAATLGMTGTTTLNLGTSATINASATALNIQADGSPDVNIAGGSSATGCTVANASGDLTCSGNITGSGSGTVGFWSRSGTTLSPATSNDIVSISSNTAGSVFTATQTGSGYAGVFTGGNVGIGTTGPTRLLDVTKTSTATSGINQDGGYFTYFANPGSTTSSSTYYDSLVSTSQSTANGIDQTNTNLRSGVFVSTYAGNNTMGAVVGAVAGMYNTSSGTVNSGIGLQTALNNTAAGTIVNARGILVGNITNSGGGAITSLNGVTINNQSGATNNTNLLIGTTTIPTGTVNYSIYNSSTYDNYFAGVLGINDTTPTEAKALVTRSTSTLTAATDEVGSYNIFTFSPASAPSSASKFAFDSVSAIGGSADTSTVTSYAGYFQVSNSNTDTSGTGANGVGAMGDVYNTSTGKAGALVALQGRVNNQSTGTITTSEGLNILAATNSGGGTVTTNYGILVAAQTVGTSDYGVRIDAADTQTLWISGNADNTTAAAGIAFGSSRDTNLYRSAANTLYTDDAFTSGGASITSFSTTNEFAFLGGSDGNVELSDSSDNFTYVDFKNLAAEDYDGRIGYSSATDNMNFYIAGSASPTFQVSATTMTFTGTTLTASSLATFTTAATLGMTSTTTLNLGTSATINANATALNIQADGTPDVNIAGGSSATGCTVANASGDLTCSGNITGTGTVGGWTRNAGSGFLYPSTITDKVGIGTTAPSSLLHINGSQTSGTVFNLSYGSATILSGDLTGLYVDLNSGNVDATNQNLTGVNFKIPTVTDTHTSGTKTLTGMLVNFGSGAGINQNGAGGTLEYIAGDFHMPALTQTAGTLNAYGTKVTTPATITTGGTAYGYYVSATGVGAGTLSGLGISSITGAAGTEYALNVGTGWDAVLRVGSTTIINGSGVTQEAGGGTSESTYTTGDILYASAANTLDKLAIGNTDGYVLKVSGGVPVWGTVTGGSCTNCLISDPSSTQTISPTGAATQGLSVRQTSTALGGNTQDIFNVTSSDGSTRYFYVDYQGNVSSGSISNTNVTITPTNDSTALTLVGTNVTSAKNQYINTKNSSGTIFDISYGAAQTLAGTIIGQNLDLSTNVTATNQSVSGQVITLPAATNTSGTQNYKALVITGGALNENGGTATNFYGADITIPAITGTSGTMTAYGVQVDTPSSITTAGTAYGFQVNAAGVGAGTLVGIDITNITAGAGTETGLQIGSGWDTNLLFNDTTSIVGLANGGTLSFNDSSGNNLCTITDGGSTGSFACTGNITGPTSGTVGYWSRSSTTLSPATANDVVSISSNDTSNAVLALTSTGAASNAFTVTANSVTTGNVENWTATGLTTGEILNIDATWAPSDGSTNDGIDINFTHSPTSSADNFTGINTLVTDGTTLANVVYGANFVSNSTGNAAKTMYGLQSGVQSSSTTADSLTSLHAWGSVTGAISSGSRFYVGVAGNNASTAASTGGTLSMFGGRFTPSTTLSNPGTSDTATNNVYGVYTAPVLTLASDCASNCTSNMYGLYAANGTSDTNGTSTKYGLYVEAQSGADNNYGAYIASNTGIGDSNPTEGRLVVYSTHTSSTANYTAGVYNVTQASSAASSAQLIGVYSLYNTAHSSNTISTIRGTDLQTSFNSTMGAQATVGATNMYAIYTSNNVGGTAPVGTVTNAANLYVDSTYFSGASGAADVVFTNKYGINIANQGLDGTAGSGTFAITSAAGIALANTSSATNNTNLLIGTTTIPTGTVNYSIYNSSAYQNYIAGNVGIGGDTTPDAYLEVGDGTDELQVASTGDLTFVDANSGSSITGPAGGALTISAANSQALNLTTTTAGNISLDPAGAGDINLVTANGSGSYLNITGLTSGTGNALCLDGSNNVVTCTVGSGGISGSGTAGQIAFFDSATNISSESSGFGWDSTNNLFTITSASTTGTVQSITDSSFTTGEILDLTGTWAPTDGSTNEAIDINLTHTPTGTNDIFQGINLNLTDGTALTNDLTALKIIVDLSGNAAKVARGLQVATTDTSTTADSIVGIQSIPVISGAISTGTRSLYVNTGQGTISAINTGGTSNSYQFFTNGGFSGASTGGTQNLYGAYLAPSSNGSNPGAANTTNNNVYGTYVLTTAINASDCTTNCTTNQYGLYVANGSSSTNGTSTKTGLYVESPTGADTNYAAIFAGGNVGIGTTAPAFPLHITNDISMVVALSQSSTDTTPGIVGFRKSRGTTASPTAVSADDNIGRFDFNGYNDAYRIAAQILASVETGVAASGADMPGRLTFLTSPDGSATPAERMRINNQGNVGIGNTAPAGRLDVLDTSNTAPSFILTNNTATTLGAGVNTTGIFDFQSTTLTTGNLLNMEANALTSGTMLGVSSTSTALAGTTTTGKGLLGNFDWTPGSATTASGDLFRLHIGPNGSTTGSLFNIVDDTSSIFAVSETAFTTSLPSNFTASGDVSVAYDIQFTNPTASYIKSAAPLTMVAGETFNSSNLTLQTYNSGSIVFDTSTSGTVLVPSAYVGIGTSSPSTFLHIKGQNVSNRGQISLEATDYQLISFYSGATTGTNLEAYQYFDVANSDMVIQNYNNGSFGDLALNSAGGNVGVGTTAPGQKFHVSIGTDGIVARFTDTSGNCDVVPIATALSCASDVRLKKDITDTHYGLEDVLKLRAVDYKWKTQTSNDNRLGFIAQEVEAIIPELVTTDPNTGYKSLAYGNFSPVLVRAIQELNSRVENALITLGADGTASSNIQADKITLTSEVVVGGLVSASNFALDSSKFNMTGALASIPVSPEGKVTVADAVNALDSKLGNIENKQASQSAELAQARILGEQAVAQAQSLDEKVASTSANLASLSAQIQELLDSTSSADNGGTDNGDLDLTPPAELLTASSSATLANLTVSDKLSAVNLSAMDATVSATLKSLGETFLGNTTIAGDISIDGTFSVSEGKSLNAFPTLYIQDSPLAMAVDIFNGKVKIGKTGNIEAEALALGDQSVGTATITAGQTEITIPSTLITATSRVFLTPMSAVSGNLYISQLTNGSGFKVKISQPNLSDVKFNWLIIGEKQ